MGLDQTYKKFIINKNSILIFFFQISRRIPGIDLSVEREGWTHGFSCTMAGSVWVAQYVADIIRNKTGVEINN